MVSTMLFSRTRVVLSERRPGSSIRLVPWQGAKANQFKAYGMTFPAPYPLGAVCLFPSTPGNYRSALRSNLRTKHSFIYIHITITDTQLMRKSAEYPDEKKNELPDEDQFTAHRCPQ